MVFLFYHLFKHFEKIASVFIASGASFSAFRHSIYVFIFRFVILHRYLAVDSGFTDVFGPSVSLVSIFIFILADRLGEFLPEIIILILVRGSMLRTMSCFVISIWPNECECSSSYEHCMRR